MKANGKKLDLETKRKAMKTVMVSVKNHCYVSIEINLALDETVRASDEPGVCDVHVTVGLSLAAAEFSWSSVLCYVVAVPDYLAWSGSGDSALGCAQHLNSLLLAL